MKTALAVAAALLVAAPTRASVQADPTTKWTADKERNSAAQWISVTIGGDQYLAYMPPAKQRGAFKSTDPQHYLVGTPLFKVVAVTKGEKKAAGKSSPTAQVTTEESPFSLEFAGKKGDASSRVVCKTGATCPPDVKLGDAAIMPLDVEKSGLKGVKTDDKDLFLVVLPPGSKPAGVGSEKSDKTASDTAPALSAWEALAAKTIGSVDPQLAKQDDTNEKRRARLVESLKSYLTASKDSKAALSENEKAYLKGMSSVNGRALPLDGFDQAAAANKDAANPASAAFIARWRHFIAADVFEYTEGKAASNRPGYVGSEGALGALNSEIRKGGDAPASELEAALAKMHPGDSRVDAAKRAIVAKFLESQAVPKSKDPKDVANAQEVQKTIEEIKAGRSRTSFDMLWRNATGDDLQAALNGKDRMQLLKIVGGNKDLLLDAYCDPSKFKGGAAGATRTRSAMKEAGLTKNDGGTLDGAGTAAAVNGLQGECGSRLQQLNSKFPDAKPGSVGNLTLDQTPQGIDKFAKKPDSKDDDAKKKAEGGGGKDKQGVATGGEDGRYGANAMPDESDKDPKMGDHIRTGAGVGLFMGMLGLFGGGPIGLLVLGAAGFAIGFGIDKLTNKGS